MSDDIKNECRRICSGLESKGRLARLLEALAGGVLLVGLMLSVLELLLVSDYLLGLPYEMRIVASALSVAVFLYVLVQRVLRPFFRMNDHANNILSLENSGGIEGNCLINFWYLHSENGDTSYLRIMAAGVQEASASASATRLYSLRRFVFPLILFVVSLGGVYALHSWRARVVEQGWKRFVMLLNDRPPVSAYSIKLAADIPEKIFAGDNLQISAKVKRDGQQVQGQMPVIVQKGTLVGGRFKANGEPVKMNRSDKGGYIATLSGNKEKFSYIVRAGSAWTEPRLVEVLPGPYIEKASLKVTPPEYTGLGGEMYSSIDNIGGMHSGSKVEIEVVIANALDKNWLELDGNVIKNNGASLKAEFVVSASGKLSIMSESESLGRKLSVRTLGLKIKDDLPPEIGIKSASGKMMALGGRVNFKVTAKDDLGLRGVGVGLVEDGDSGFTELKNWRSSRTPGKKSAELEYALLLDPQKFLPGQSYTFKAYAEDYNPAGKRRYSSILTLRVAANSELDVKGDDALVNGFRHLREAVQQQINAIGFSKNLKVNLKEIISKKQMPRQRQRLTHLQALVRRSVQQAYSAFNSNKDFKDYAKALEPVQKLLIAQVMRDIPRLIGNAKQSDITAQISVIINQQDYIHQRLQKLLGRVYQENLKENGKLKGKDMQPPVNTAKVVAETLDGLKKFVEAQKKILEKSKTLLDKGEDDLSDEDEKILGELAKKEAELAAFLEEKMQDFSKIPSQDFSDSNVVEEFNEVYQEIQKAAAHLFAKRIELAVPREQAGLENAETLVHNLERWLPDHADNILWSMEELDQPPEAEVAELPDELEDIIGDLLEQESDMEEAIEDIGSTFMDSLDKGAGWGASDGPISNMSARGVTGNILPNQMEVGGRSGEGRSGRSSGQMVEATAEGKEGGRKTPTRMTRTPFETGSVDDKSKEEPGGATGGGKLSGSSAEGLRGQVPAELKQKMQRLQQTQTGIRQKAEQVRLQLKKRNLPDSQINIAIQKFKEIENAAASGQAQKLRSLHKSAIDALRQSKGALSEKAQVRGKGENDARSSRSEVYRGMREKVLPGYKELTDKYFESILQIQ